VIFLQSVSQSKCHEIYNKQQPTNFSILFIRSRASSEHFTSTYSGSRFHLEIHQNRGLPPYISKLSLVTHFRSLPVPVYFESKPVSRAVTVCVYEGVGEEPAIYNIDSHIHEPISRSLFRELETGPASSGYSTPEFWVPFGYFQV
jgi:hypothetical protein